MLQKLFKFNGGVKPATNKAASTRDPIKPVPMPRQLVVPLHQHVGGTPHPLVEAGEQVLKGQRIGAADGNVSSAIHAPTSGRVLAIEPRVMAHSSGLSSLSVVIEPDGEDRWIDTAPMPWRSMSPDEIRDELRDAGIVGLGGAVFPSHLKLKPGNEGTHTLVINGAECEPFITCDDLLMRERGDQIVRGALIMQAMLKAQRVLVGIEDNKPEAIAQMQAAVQRNGTTSMQVIAIPTRYPAGGAKQLIRVLTGIEVPHGRRSTDYGVQCFNTGTAYAIADAVEKGRPLISRIVTVAGNVERPGNYEVLFGTPMDHLAALAGIKADTDRFIMGGPMMGFRMPAYDVPVVKATNCVLVGSEALFPAPAPEMACIRCGECARACPADLQPFELYWHSRAKNFGKAQEYHLFDCIECGCCAYVCPSHIPLVDYYRFAKSEVWARERQKDAADVARERFEFRNERIEREKREKAEKLAAKTAASRAAASSAPGAEQGEAAPAAASTAADDSKKALIAAAMARAKAQRDAADQAAAPVATPPASAPDSAPATTAPAPQDRSI
ncbi:electron transport complex subunit RsxC [Niveibacterium sp. 24ML]|uniref:electron transport complex subunit RsxC n=1 Tax=Niveibacterium sp. 24ML TaxID=2985512 RepID=UPI0022716B01|nr:electron transport complex subunit RsxC [Niveibacterium sp. 24ML]MCX9156136.1 electron transport complex subunit RsxC [Niveibacterium sp. 24ML]